MKTNFDRDVNNRSPKLEIASIQRAETFVGFETQVEATEKSCSSDKLIVRGKATSPLVQKTAYGQSLLISGQDRRSRVLDTMFSPWRLICSLKISCKDGSEYVGTGWIAGPRLIITAGHCVYNESYDGGWANEITIIPGRDGSNEPFGSFKSTKLHSVKEWVDSGDENNDIGAIILESDIGSDIGFFAFGAYPNSDLESQLINISGYPGSVYGEEQMHHANRISNTTKYKLYYDIDTEGGQSGSPVWFYNDDNKAVVIGIHSNGAGYAISANSGVRITNSLAKQIAEWRTI